jgi:phosphatidylserine decarboxylase
VDGSISQIGDIKSGKLFQAKGFTFTLAELLAEETGYEKFLSGQFATLYLAPKDYHRIHMPFDGVLHKTTYIPGKLFSVNTVTANHVSGLFAKNERLVCHFHTAFGEMILVLVGACIVGAINTVWGGKISPRSKTTQTSVYPFNNIQLKKGDLLGYFELGSTVIALFPENTIEFYDEFITSPSIKMGQRMAALNPALLIKENYIYREEKIEKDSVITI